MKKLVVIAILGMFLFSKFSIAQDLPNPAQTNQRGGNKQMNKEFKQDLNLSKDQEEKMKAAGKIRKEKIQAIKAQNLEKSAKRTAMKNANDEYQANIATFLSKEQLDKLQAKKNERKEMRKERYKSRKG